MIFRYLKMDDMIDISMLVTFDCIASVIVGYDRRRPALAVFLMHHSIGMTNL